MKRTKYIYGYFRLNFFRLYIPPIKISFLMWISKYIFKILKSKDENVINIISLTEEDLKVVFKEISNAEPNEFVNIYVYDEGKKDTIEIIIKGWGGIFEK